VTALPKIEYGAYCPADEEAMVTLLADVFPRHDPPAYAVGLTPADFEAFVRLLCPAVEADGLTIVARLPDTGELVGVMLNQDSSTPMPDGMDRLSPRFNPIFDILGELDSEYRGGREPPRGESLHLFLLGVSEHVAGRGVAQQLVAGSVAHGRSRGYRVAVTEATNKVSQHIFRKQGFVERVHRSYAAHRFEGQAVFAAIEQHGGPILMDKILAR
jgi:ribosomal protein S18 acetylase RimI-like enzyme